jgi:hypothetical protein
VQMHVVYPIFLSCRGDDWQLLEDVGALCPWIWLDLLTIAAITTHH